MSDFASGENIARARAAARAHNLQPASARHVLLSVAAYVNGAPARPSYQTLADDTGLSASQVRHLIDALAAAGYLAESREPRKGGGWGKPVWALGPTCQVSADGHMPQEQVSATRQSSVSPQTHASVYRQTPKRVQSPRTVGRPPFVALMEGGVEERREEKDPPTPQPAKQQKVAAVADAIKAAGLKAPRVSGRDAGAINGCDAPPEEIAEAWRRLAVGEWPPSSASPRDKAFAAGNRALWFVVDRLNAILADGPAPRPVNGAAVAELAAHRKRMQERLADRERQRTHQPPARP